MNSNFNIYRLKGKTKGSWQLPLKGILLEDEKGVLREIEYVKGSDSIFKKDHKGDQKPENIWIDEGFIRVHKGDKVLNEIFQKHPWFNIKYELDDEEVKAERKLSMLEMKRKAANMVNSSDDDKIKAMAMAIFGGQGMLWGVKKCTAALLEEAYERPEKLLRSLEAEDYESKYIAALAFNKGIVKYNNTKTAIIWASGDQGVIIYLAKGENGINKLGEYLAVETEESMVTLQEIGNRINGESTSITEKPNKTGRGRKAQAAEA